MILQRVFKDFDLLWKLKVKNLFLEVPYNSTDNSNQKTTYKYKYDFNDNWIEQTEYINDAATKITERQIDYYK